MRTSILAPVLLSVGALAAPAALDKRVMETRLIVKTVTTTETIGHRPTGVAGGPPGNEFRHTPVGGPASHSHGGNSPVSVPTPTNTVVSPPAETPSSPPVASPPVVSPPSAPKPSSPAAPASPPASSSSTAASPPSTGGGSSSGGPTSNGVPFIDTINKWRVAMGHSQLTWDSTLAANAQKTVVDSNGGQGGEMNHELNPGSHAQVLGPGFETIPSGTVQYATGISANGASWADALAGMTPFEITYVAWLCEKPDAAGLSGTNACSVMTNVLNSHNKEAGTGHYDILTGNYKTIGCGYQPKPSPDPQWPQMAGLYGCDLS